MSCRLEILSNLPIPRSFDALPDFLGITKETLSNLLSFQNLMPLPGGEADKIGNRYEGRWTTHCIIDVMDEKADSIRLEKPGEDAFEFFLQRDNQMECHQVKRQKSGRGQWTLSSLQDKQVHVLADFWKSLKQTGSSCVFISTEAAAELRELAQRARDSISWTEFEGKYLDQTRARHLETLCEKWSSCSQREAYEALQRVQVETISEDLLVKIVESRLSALVEGDPETIRLQLAELALNRIHQELTGHDIWQYLLDEKGYRRREWGKDEHVLAAVEQTNQRYLRPLQEMTIGGHKIRRDEAQTAFEELTHSRQSIILVGEAGGGKTDVAVQIVDKLLQEGLPVLVFRIDRLEPTLLPKEVGERLGLPGSPAIVLASIAHKRECVLVIDQLDAVSLASGRNPDFFECISEIIEQARAHPNIKLLLVCRKFDLENDPRLKRLTKEKGFAQTIHINRLSSEKVKEVIDSLRLDSTHLNDKQITLLSTPLHLSLLAEIAGDKTIDTLGFETAKDLFEKFWEYKQQQVSRRLGRSAKWIEVIDSLCEYMSRQQSQVLSAPQHIVDEYRDDAKAMASEHLLVWEGKRIAFFHESFFDYAFARRFAAREQKLLPFLRSNEQHLFQRAQVRQILLNEREVDFDQYLQDLQELLTSHDIRFHLKQIVFALVGTLADPKEDEWEIINPFIEGSTDPAAGQVWQSLRGSVSWFNLLNSLGVIRQWLQSQNEYHVNQALIVLSTVQDYVPEQIVELLELLIEREDQIGRERLKTCIRLSGKSGRCLFELFLRLVDLGIFDASEKVTDQTYDFWFQIYDLAKQSGEWACEAIGAYLNRVLDQSVASKRLNLFDPNADAFTFAGSQFADPTLMKSADNAPNAFVRYILPSMLRIIEVTANRQGEPPWRDPIWWYRSYGEGYGTAHELLHHLEISLSKVASDFPEDFSRIVQQSLYESDFETVQYLLVRAYAANGEKFADEAIDYLCAKPTRLEIGYSGAAGNIHAAPYWATRQLLEATTLYCSDKKLLQLEKLLLTYYPVMKKSSDWETMKWVLRLYGYEQFVLLDGINSSRRSYLVNRRLQEWRRKFIAVKLLESPGIINPPEAIEAHDVESPISRAAAPKMTDAQWLRAIARYSDNNIDFNSRRRESIVGGAGVLASDLESQVKKDANRFAQLLLQFPDTVNTLYFDAVLRGISEVGIDVDTALMLCQHCHRLSRKPCGQSISWLIRKLSQLPWTEDAYAIVSWYAINDPNPDFEECITISDKRNLLSRGINSVRGNATSTIASLIFADKHRASYFQSVLQQVVSDPDISVRVCAAEALTAMLNHDRDTAVQLFLELCNTQEDLLLSTQPVERFLHYALQSHFEQLKPVLDRMLSSDLLEVVEAGARNSCCMSLVLEQAKPLADHCLSGHEGHRLAAAEVFANNIRSAHFRQECKDALIQLFNDPEEKVRAQSARCFFDMEGEELSEYLDLVNQFISSAAFLNSFHDLIWAMERTTARLPEVICMMCDRYITDLLEENSRNGKAFRTDINLICKLLMTSYSQSSKQPELQSQCLNLIDRLAVIGLYDLDKVLEEYER